MNIAFINCNKNIVSYLNLHILEFCTRGQVDHWKSNINNNSIIHSTIMDIQNLSSKIIF